MTFQVWWVIPIALVALAAFLIWRGKVSDDPVTGAMQEIAGLGLVVAAAASTLVGLVAS